MHVITRKRLNDFAALHADALAPLERWYRLMKQNNFGNFAELRSLFPSADQVGNRTVFNLGETSIDLSPPFIIIGGGFIFVMS